MNREIKFRVYTKDTWMDGTNGTDMLYDYQDTTYVESFGFKDIHLMQFTGLKDKNGVDIYEGDVLITKNQDKAKMIWHNEFACFCYETIDYVVKGEYQFTFKDFEVEIIGNIYENPELLNK